MYYIIIYMYRYIDKYVIYVVLQCWFVVASTTLLYVRRTNFSKSCPQPIVVIPFDVYFLRTLFKKDHLPLRISRSYLIYISYFFCSPQKS